MGFGDHSITKQTYELIQAILPAGKTILELGSGNGTKELVKYYNVISIEENEKWVNVVPESYMFHSTGR